MQNKFEQIYQDLQAGSVVLADFYFDEWNNANLITQINHHSQIESLQLYRKFTSKGWVNQVSFFN